MSYNQTERAQVLAEALPYIQKYSGKTIVVKYGGNAMISDELRHAVISDTILLPGGHAGGGGPRRRPEITEMLKNGQGVKIRGRPAVYRPKETMDVVQQVLSGR